MNGKLRRAFTLVEILLVIVIIGVLAGMLVARLSGRTQEAKITAAQGDVRGQLSLALDLFEGDTGRYPSEEEGLKALMENPGIDGWKGPYLKSDLKPDPWGNAYVYRLDTERPGMYVLHSAGPDGKTGSQDDIKQ